MYEKINEPLSIRGLKLKNRIVFAPTTLGLSEEEYLERLGIIAAGGAAMLVIGDVPVLRHSLFAKSLYSTKGFEFYRRVTEAIHKNGAKACAQLHVSDSDIKGMLRYVPGMLMKRITPDRLRELMNERTGPYITGIPESKIGKITASFGDAAVLAGKAGFDMIQFMGTGCAEASVPPYSIIEPTPTAQVRPTGPNLPVSVLQPSDRLFPICLSNTNWQCVRKIRIMAMPEFWWRSCLFSCLFWRRRVLTVIMLRWRTIPPFQIRFLQNPTPIFPERAAF